VLGVRNCVWIVRVSAGKCEINILYLYQTLVSRHDTGGNLYRRVRKLLLQVPELRVGPTEIPLARYISLLDELGHMTHDEARLSSR